MTKKLVNRLPDKAFMQRFFVLFIPVCLLFFLALFVLDAAQWSTYKTALEKQESERVEDIADLSRIDVAATLPAVYEVASSHHLQRYLNLNSSADLQEFTAELLMLARFAEHLEQLRFLDEAGQEVVRVRNDRGYPRVVSGAQLQDKSRRNYFLDLMRLQAGEFYISPVDLNQENGTLEFPIKPTVRVGVPVFDNTGKNRGAVIINLRYGRFLQRVEDRNAMREDDGLLMVLNRDGYWLKGQSAEDEWGFALGKPERTFARDYPVEWQQIGARESGVQHTSLGVFAHTTVHLPRSAERLTPDYLKIVSYVSPEVLSENRLIRNQLGWIALALLVLTMGTGLVVSNLLNRERTLAIVERKNAQLGDKTLRLESIIEGTRVGTWEWNVQTGETRFNQYWAEMLGYTLEELAPVSLQTWIDLTHPDDLKCSNELLQKHFAGQLTYYECEIRMRHRLGHWIWVLDRGRVNRWLADGRPSMMFGTHQDISQRKLAEHEMEHIAHHDLLTGLPNRILLEDRLQQILSAAKREQSQFALLFIDLDEFKPVNDNYGHAVGDEVLKESARRMLECLRASDTVARVGGDEFVGILPRIQQGADAVAVAAKMRRLIAEPFLIDGLKVSISSSIGIALYPEDGDNEDTLLENADSAMYQAKKNGRNQVRLYQT
ncbi:MAG: diguanylate cyclase [Gallionella sp.]|nr:diguanylate cyclase [Gallionella sp.]